jgi:hypothetical protein
MKSTRKYEDLPMARCAWAIALLIAIATLLLVVTSSVKYMSTQPYTTVEGTCTAP